jgi:hypothetical protein
MPAPLPEPNPYPADLFAEASVPGRVWWARPAEPRQEKNITHQPCPTRVPFHPPVTRTRPLAGSKGRILCTAWGLRSAARIDFLLRGASVLLDGFRLARRAKRLSRLWANRWRSGGGKEAGPVPLFTRGTRRTKDSSRPFPCSPCENGAERCRAGRQGSPDIFPARRVTTSRRAAHDPLPREWEIRPKVDCQASVRANLTGHEPRHVPSARLFATEGARRVGKVFLSGCFVPAQPTGTESARIARGSPRASP